MTSSIIGNEAGIRFGQHRDRTLNVHRRDGCDPHRCSGHRGARSTLGLAAHPRDCHSGQLPRPDVGHDSQRPTRVPRRDHGHAFHHRFRRVGGRCLGHWLALDVGGGMDTSTGWPIAFLVIAVGGLTGPVAIWWSLRAKQRGGAAAGGSEKNRAGFGAAAARKGSGPKPSWPTSRSGEIAREVSTSAHHRSAPVSAGSLLRCHFTATALSVRAIRLNAPSQRRQPEFGIPLPSG